MYQRSDLIEIDIEIQSIIDKKKELIKQIIEKQELLTQFNQEGKCPLCFPRYLWNTETYRTWWTIDMLERQIQIYNEFIIKFL